MRRKSERTATKKVKTSPEKKMEKLKRTRTRRRKQSTSSENESEEGSPVREVETVEESVKEAPPTTPVKEASPEEQQDQVWQVKTAEASGDGGEIQKLKICLTRPPSTPERVDRSPRSKRKHSRATSSSDTPSSEGVDDKKRSRRSKKNRESRDELEKNQDSQGDEPEVEAENSSEVAKKSDNEISQSTEHADQSIQEDTPVSTTTEEVKGNEPDTQTKEPKSNEPDTQTKEPKGNEPDTQTYENSEPETKVHDKSDADTTVASPKSYNNEVNTPEKQNRRRSDSVEKSEVLEIHAEADDSRIEASETQLTPQRDSKRDKADNSRDQEAVYKEKVSISQDKSVSEEKRSAKKDRSKTTNKNDVVESSVNLEKKKKSRRVSNDSDKDKDADDSVERYRSKDIEHTNSTSPAQDENINNGPVTPFVVNRKRKWGARPKLTSQKSITISTDVLKEIIPDVKPVEFEEVIEEKKHKRIEVTEKIERKIERPILPKIVIDNTENVVSLDDDMDHKENIIKREINLAANRRISIVKENDSILARPPSPPRHKQSNILYITNLVRPFTLPQLKNLLQRTGRIAENGFWIDRIKSKCFVQFENEDQAVETRHALHGVTWPVSNPKALQVDFSTREAFDKARLSEESDTAPVSSIPLTVEEWLREQDIKRERGELDKPWERKVATREWDLGKNDKDKDGVKERLRRDDRILDKRRMRSQERSPEPARKFKKKEEEAPAKLLDDLFRKTKTTPCIYWLPLSAETIAIKEEQRRKHMEEHERRLQELRRHRERERRH